MLGGTFATGPDGTLWSADAGRRPRRARDARGRRDLPRARARHAAATRRSTSPAARASSRWSAPPTARCGSPTPAARGSSGSRRPARRQVDRRAARPARARRRRERRDVVRAASGLGTSTPPGGVSAVRRSSGRSDRRRGRARRERLVCDGHLHARARDPGGEVTTAPAPIPARRIGFDPAGGMWLASAPRLVHVAPARRSGRATSVRRRSASTAAAATVSLRALRRAGGVVVHGARARRGLRRRRLHRRPRRGDQRRGDPAGDRRAAERRHRRPAACPPRSSALERAAGGGEAAAARPAALRDATARATPR